MEFDERAQPPTIGMPIPSWELEHKLPIQGGVGPVIMDDFTTYRINSVYMDATDQTHLIRQWQACLTLILAFVFVIFFSAFVSLMFFSRNHSVAEGVRGPHILLLAICAVFAAYACYEGRREYFTLKFRPIRFCRSERRIFAVRKRRFFANQNEGDHVSVASWDDSSIFCIRRGKGQCEDRYHICCYQLDSNGLVTQAFAIGRQWQGIAGMEKLLAQWNYWCWYMNHGPEDLPVPALFVAEDESFRESMHSCMYSEGYTGTAAFEFIAFPLIVMLALARAASQMTCRNPIWPEWIVHASELSASDPFEEPKGATPIGWEHTAIAWSRGDYPENPCRATEGWDRNLTASCNAQRWSKDKAVLSIVKNESGCAADQKN